ncbi:hypothetical protein BO83DRAFT_229723 [Aspergillus eucalypticola CBS 122712]|uniref:Secreted protein n=1 Tax=Aspergillus eucalypticola (strain CBS 122712 / IBT 29274) TaxID=1448314 RepID=A0A317VWK0_ASPEC|nr:uncharacterized protein BO83DRAFT_229723 [Aspergillus eucalypticola CBS 122712]PWY77959.1 hypothetical protein BO83DRAFT_229723 [Aspergillus eucalypticola CBS 122712]
MHCSLSRKIRFLSLISQSTLALFCLTGVTAKDRSAGPSAPAGWIVDPSRVCDLGGPIIHSRHSNEHLGKYLVWIIHGMILQLSTGAATHGGSERLRLEEGRRGPSWAVDRSSRRGSS